MGAHQFLSKGTSASESANLWIFRRLADVGDQKPESDVSDGLRLRNPVIAIISLLR
jgi:hypothetical protein